MKVYGFPLSPFVRKVHLVAAEKGIAVEVAMSDRANPAEEFLKASPFRKIPALVDGDFHLADSTAIVTYFDALQPEPPLVPGTPQQKARAIWFEEFMDTMMIAAGGKIMFNRFVGPKFLGVPGDEAVAAQGEAELAPLLDYLESQCGDGWLAGGEFSIGDIAVASAFKSLSYVGKEPNPATHPATAAWYERVKTRASWQAVAGLESAMMSRAGG